MYMLPAAAPFPPGWGKHALPCVHSAPILPDAATLRRSAEWVVIKFLAAGEADSLDNIDAQFFGLMGFTGPYCGTYGELMM